MILSNTRARYPAKSVPYPLLPPDRRDARPPRGRPDRTASQRAGGPALKAPERAAARAEDLLLVGEQGRPRVVRAAALLDAGEEKRNDHGNDGEEADDGEERFAE